MISQLRSGYIVPASLGQYQWLCVISLAVIYNVTVVIARQTFTDIQTKNFIAWIVLDSVCDVVYILDMMFKAQTGNGLSSKSRLVTYGVHNIIMTFL